MIHFTCDLCGKDLESAKLNRFVVRIEVYPGKDPNRITDEDLDEDHMESLAQYLQNAADSAANTNTDTNANPPADNEPNVEPDQVQLRYDLCPNCQRKFLKDPLGKSRTRHLRFSKN